MVGKILFLEAKMARYGANVTYQGLSGKTYTFELWELDSAWAKVPAVFIATKKDYNPRGEGVYPILGCGETSDMRDFFSDKLTIKQLKESGAKMVCVRRETNRQIREKVKEDIKGYYSPECND